MTIETVPISDLSPDPANVRRHPEGQIEKLVASLRRWGQTLPLLADNNDVVRIGNARLEAMKRLGWSEVKVVRLDLSASEWTALAIADNKLHDDSEFDEQGLSQILNALAAEDSDLASAAGFTPDELVKLIADTNGQSEPEAPEDFPSYDESIETQYRCPSCNYEWFGKAK